MASNEQHFESAPSDEMKANKTTEIKRTRVHSEYVLPSDRHPFSVHFEILSRFVRFARNNPLPADAVEGNGVPKQSAAMNVRFMRDIGLLKADTRGHYSATDQALDFIYAKNADPERAKAKLREILNNQWFTQTVVTHLQMEGVSPRAKLISDIAMATRTDVNVKAPALGVILDYLVYAGIIAEDDQGIRLVSVNCLGGSPVSAIASGPGASALVTNAPMKSMTMSGTNNPTSASAVSEEWEEIQTKDFYVKVRSDLEVYSDLKEAIKLLENRVKRAIKNLNLQFDENSVGERTGDSQEGGDA